MSNSRQPEPLPSVPVQPSNPGSSVSTNHNILPRPVPRPNHNRFHPFRRFKPHIAAAIALITLTVTTITLLPSFWGAKYGREALELARWTAWKDYIEACQKVSDSNLGSGFSTSPYLTPFSSISLARVLVVNRL